MMLRTNIHNSSEIFIRHRAQTNENRISVQLGMESAKNWKFPTVVVDYERKIPSLKRKSLSLCFAIIIVKFIEASSRVEIIRLWSHSPAQLFVDCLQAFPRKTIICHHAFLISLSHFPSLSLHSSASLLCENLSVSPHFPWFFISQTYNATTTGIIRHLVNIHTFTRTCLSTSHFELFQ